MRQADKSGQTETKKQKNKSTGQQAMAEKKVQLLSFWVSPFSQRVELALALKGIQYEKLEQNLADKSPLLLASNPVYKKIPVLLHGDHAICESAIILQYIDEAFPDHLPLLLPADAHGRATARFWADFFDKKIAEGLFAVVKSQGDAQRAAIDALKENLQTLEQRLVKVSGGGSSPFFSGGDEMGFVDLVLAPVSSWFPYVEAEGGCELGLEERCPRLHAWLAAFRGSAIASVLPEVEKLTEFARNIIIQKRTTTP